MISRRCFLVLLVGAFVGGCASSGTNGASERRDRAGTRVHVYQKQRLPTAAYERVGTVTGSVCKKDVYSGAPSRAEAVSAMKQQVVRAGGNGVFAVTCRRGPVEECSKAHQCTGTAIRVRSVDAIPRGERKRAVPFGEGKARYGTGWVMAPGLVVTSHRLVDDRSTFTVSTPDTTVDAKLVARDPVHSIALLRTSQSFELPSPLPLAADSVPTGERAFTVGYPGLEAAGIRAATGIVSGQSGALGDARVYRATVVPPSDWGGAPLLNFRGEVLGVLVPSRVTQEFTPTGSGSESISYALKNEYLRRLRARLDSVSGEASSAPLPVRREASSLLPVLNTVRPSILRVTAR